MEEAIVPARVLCVGVAVQDNMFAIERLPSEPTKVFARDFCQVGGGPAANAAVTVAQLGGKASLWARVGADAVGAGIVSELAGYGVDTARVKQIPDRRSGVSAVLIDGNGERSIVAFADRKLDTDTNWLPRELPADIDAILCDVRWPAASEHVMKLARDTRIPIVLDADLTDDDAVGRLFGMATHVVFSSPALRRHTGRAAIDEALKQAQDQTKGVVAVTRGAEGFSWLEDGAVRSIPAMRVDVVDTLAAGDVFHGAFALGLGEGHRTEGAGQFATAAAALKCTRWGGRSGIPTRRELDDFIATAA
jgi:sulfofructose kinase